MERGSGQLYDAAWQAAALRVVEYGWLDDAVRDVLGLDRFRVAAAAWGGPPATARARQTEVPV